jgi:hypothetical protein
VSVKKNLDIAQQFLTKLGEGASPEEVAKLFSAGTSQATPASCPGLADWSQDGALRRCRLRARHGSDDRANRFGGSRCARQ